MDLETKEAVARRLRRVTGQLAGIERMVDEDRYCIDVLVQVAAVRAALARVAQIMLARHVDGCVVEALTGEDPADRRRKLDELVDLFGRYAS